MLMQKPDDPLTPDPEGNSEVDPPVADPPDPTTPASEPDPTPTVEEPQGRTKEELEQLVGVYETTIEEQGREVARLNTERNVPVETSVVPVVPVEVSAEEFWRNPSESVRSIVEDTVKGQLKEIIQPFKDDLSRNSANEAWREARSLHPDLDQYKPMIDALLSKSGKVDPTFTEIEMYYYMAVGFTSKEGKPTTLPAPPTAPPQHPPSSHPVVIDGPRGPELRELTESEKTLARHNNMSDEEFLKYQAMDEREIVTPEPSNV